eukprot:NODE_5719_length_1741_cov_5.681537.p1 GENE.NODE_5719_length_1741_cov_5.681537~~NODE_5719_length_1741_cov_5.681537.p1  ORF type:complete len:437 (+),score=62.62 NODE_5719_length_1741_cov_5.681537:141-1451(+)
MAPLSRQITLGVNDKMCVHMSKYSSRMTTQVRVLPTKRFVPRATLVRSIEKRVSSEAFFRRLRSISDAPTLTAYELPEDEFDVDRHVIYTDMPELEHAAELPHEAASRAIMARSFPSGQPQWDLSTYTDGHDGHGVVFRWNHWIGDGLSSFVTLARLFDWDYEVLPVVQERRIDLSSVTWAQRLRSFKLSFGGPQNEYHNVWGGVGSDAAVPLGDAIRHSIDEARVVTMVADLGEVKAAAQRQSVTVTVLLLDVAMRTFIHFQGRHGRKEVRDPLAIYTTAAMGRDAGMANESKLIQVRIPLEAPSTEIGRIWADTLGQHLELMSAERAIYLGFERLGMLGGVMDSLLKVEMEDKKKIDLTVTTLPGPKHPQAICGVPMTGMYNCLGHSSFPRFTCSGYAGKVFITLGVGSEVSKNSAAVRRVWNEKLSDVLSGAT